jgi:phage tail-like protein
VERDAVEAYKWYSLAARNPKNIFAITNRRALASHMTETDIIEYREGSEDITVRKLPGKRKYTNISLKRGYTPDGKDLWAWRKSVMEGKTQRKGGTISLLDESRKVALTWEFSEGWPSKWAGPAFNAKNNDIAIEEMEICVEGLALQT